MKDIRKDLAERLSAISEERARCKAELEKLTRKEELLNLLIAEEDARWQKQRPRMPQRKKAEAKQAPIASFIMNTLADGGIRRTDELVALAQANNLLVDSKSPKKSMHIALVALKRRGIVEMPESSCWRAAGKKEDAAENK